MSGAEVARQARAKRPTLPILFITGFADRAALAGVSETHIVGKPFVNDELVTKLKADPNGAYFEKFLMRGQVGKVAVTGWGSDLFLKQQALGGSFDKGIRWQLDGSYQQLPHIYSLQARSPFTNAASRSSSCASSIRAT